MRIVLAVVGLVASIPVAMAALALWLVLMLSPGIAVGLLLADALGVLP